MTEEYHDESWKWRIKLLRTLVDRGWFFSSGEVITEALRSLTDTEKEARSAQILTMIESTEDEENIISMIKREFLKRP